MLNEKPKLFLIEWHDAHSGSGWYNDDEVVKFINKEKCICSEVGWLISESKDEIVVACRRMKWKEEGDAEWGMLQKIPKSWIRKKEILIKDLITRKEAKKRHVNK